MANEEASHDRLRRMIDTALLTGQEWCVGSLLSKVQYRAPLEGVQYDCRVVLEYFWELARTGMVAVPGDSIHDEPRLFLTERGRRLLEKGEASPHDPNKYLLAVKARIGQPDQIVLTYLAEAVDGWKSGLNRSSAVMLGCACERLVLMLGEAISQSNHAPWTTKIAGKLAKRVFISDLFDDIRDCLIQLKGQKLLPRELGEAIDRKLSAIFDHARGLRNQTGHPTGEEVSSDDAEAGLLLFPGFYELVNNLIQHVQGTSPAAAGHPGEPK